MNSSTTEKQTHTQKPDPPAVAKREWGRGGMDREVGIRCKLFYTGATDNKIPLYNTGNSGQYLVINHNGKEYIWITETLCLTAEINATL